MEENKLKERSIEFLNLNDCFIYDLKKISSVLVCVSMLEEEVKSKYILDAVDSISKNLDMTIENYDNKSDFVRNELKKNSIS